MVTLEEYLKMENKVVCVNKKVPPVKVGDVVEAKCFKEARQPGSAICKVDDFILFVEDAKPNEDVKVKITRVLATYGFGRRNVDEFKA